MGIYLILPIGEAEMSNVSWSAGAADDNMVMTLMAITVTRNSTRFVANWKEVPVNAVIRLEGAHWGDRP
jgi:hypothetical protein